MRFDAATRTRILNDMELGIDPTGSTVEVKVGAAWYAATWLGVAVVTETDPKTGLPKKWTQTARTTGYFAGPEAAVVAATVLLTATRHLTQTRVTAGTDVIVADSSPVDVV